MVRIALILAVAAFCLYTTPPPNPRILAALDALSSRHSHQVRGDTDGSFYCPMEPDVRSRLCDGFRAEESALRELLGVDFGWNL